MDSVDLVIVGGGAAGCILASRLSKDERRNVILIEAGVDTPPGGVPEDIRDTYPIAYANPDYFWPGLEATGLVGAARSPYPQPRIMGGGSSVMGMWALRGQPADYDGWRDRGAVGWAWDDVLPAFNRLEHDLDFSGPAHGKDGPIPIRRHFRAAWPGFARAMADAAGRRGFRYREDINADFEDGVFPVPVTNNESGRVSAAMGYLTDAVRRRPNLKVLTRARALRIVFEKGRAVAIALRHPDGAPATIRGTEFILAAGAVHSPAILLRSGIGPAAVLAARGIEAVANIPAVGANLQNHCVLNLATRIDPAARQSKGLRTYGLACARVSSGIPDAPRGDLHLQFIAKTGPYAHGDRLGIAGSALYAPMSRGAVTLAAADPDVTPNVDFRLLEHPRDRACMAKAIMLTLQLLDDPAVSVIRGGVITVAPSSLARRLNRPSRVNQVISALLAIILDAPLPVRQALLRQAGTMLPLQLGRSVDPADLLAFVTPVFHPAGTCAMGPAGDPGAVVDPSCRVQGVHGIRVIDASIMPSIPTGNTCIPTMMIAEHASAMLIRERS